MPTKSPGTGKRGLAPYDKGARFFFWLTMSPIIALERQAWHAATDLLPVEWCSMCSIVALDG